MSLGLGLFLIGLAIFVGACTGFLIMGLLCGSIKDRGENEVRILQDKIRDEHIKFVTLQDKYKLLLDDFKKQMQK